MRHAIGIDIGGGSTKIGLVSETGEILARSTIAAVPGQPGEVIFDVYASAIGGLVPQGLPLSLPRPSRILRDEPSLREIESCKTLFQTCLLAE